MMPKGVDHTMPYTNVNELLGVQKSLMPKGVDHPEFNQSGGAPKSAKIFDAERR